MNTVAQTLDTLVAGNPELADLAGLYRAILPLLAEAQAEVEPFSLPPETIRQKLAGGLPLLLGEPLPFDPVATTDLFLRLCRKIEEIGLPPAERSIWSFFRGGRPDPAALLVEAQQGNEIVLRAIAARQIRQAVEQNQLALSITWEALAAGDLDTVKRVAQELQLEPDLWRTLAQNSLKPSLRAWAGGIKVDLREWQRGYCPLCGSTAVLSELQGKVEARHLRCLMCGADWAYPRLQCAFCFNQDYRLLNYFSLAGEAEKYSLQACDVCRKYLKVIRSFEPAPVDRLTLEDLATLHLDLIAAERHYVH